jgi:hypothetical protein
MKKIGCCTSCGKEVYEITRRFPSDHPYAKEPMEVGKPINAITRTLLLSDNSEMNLTYCPDCNVDYEKDWQIVLDAWKREMSDDYRKNLKLSKITNKEPYNKWFEKMLTVKIVSVIGEKRA